MKRLKTEKVKRGRIILSAILTFCIALLSLGFGSYFGYVTLNINYITIGTMTPAIGGLLVIAGFFIFFGCIGGVISLKEIFISSRNEEKFSAYKGSLISAIIYYVIIAIISIVGLIMSFVSYIPSSFTWTIIGLSFLSIALCAGAFYCVLRELKMHKKNKNKPKESVGRESGAANMDLSASEIHKFSSAHMVDNKNSINKSLNSQNINNFKDGVKEENSNNLDPQNINNDKIDTINQVLNNQINNQAKEEMDFVSLAEKLMQLEELRKAGLINDQEYQALKKKCI